ncbi:uncharacterized protein LOC109081667 [Cyprinus carpio]|uniref:Uncharacterized protein LOC109081667 n=1 Tax=Cyprinus carpio TaxID=7962 RepID=A0A9Q9XHW5_CYPCA|nr:uncharacterized protein LOC109081667 [Cyprinus carpio]
MEVQCPMCAAKVLHLRHQADHAAAGQRKGLTAGLEVFCMRDQLQLHRLPPPVEPSGTHDKKMKAVVQGLQLEVSVDQLKKLRAKNPTVRLVSHMDDLEAGVASQLALPQPQPPEKQAMLPQPAEECLQFLGEFESTLDHQMTVSLQERRMLTGPRNVKAGYASHQGQVCLQAPSPLWSPGKKGGETLGTYPGRALPPGWSHNVRFLPLKLTSCFIVLFRLVICNLTGKCCESLSSVLQSSNSCLRDLDLSNNDLQDSGVKLLSVGLKSSYCQLNILRLSGCMVTEEGCGCLSSALTSNPSNMRELDLSYNHPGESGVKLLSEILSHPNCTLDKLNVDHGGDFRITAGLHKYACDLTLDLNTANNHLIVSEENKKVIHVKEDQLYSDHPERFDECSQILCRESLSGRCYWEAEWSGHDADMSVTYKCISRKGGSDDCWFGSNKNSWSLICSDFGFTVRHNKKFTVLHVPLRSSKRVGVYVDMSAGTLSFYSISDTLTHLHTFCSTFTEPLYAGFVVCEGSSVSL